MSLSKLAVVLVFLVVGGLAVGFHPFWMTDEWCFERAKDPKVMVCLLRDNRISYGLSQSEIERFYIGEYAPFGRKVGVRGLGVHIYGGWWTGWMDMFGNIYIEFIS